MGIWGGETETGGAFVWGQQGLFPVTNYLFQAGKGLSSLQLQLLLTTIPALSLVSGATGKEKDTGKLARPRSLAHPLLGAGRSGWSNRSAASPTGPAVVAVVLPSEWTVAGRMQNSKHANAAKFRPCPPLPPPQR